MPFVFFFWVLVVTLIFIFNDDFDTLIEDLSYQ